MPLGSVLVLVRQISQLNPVACPLKTCCVVRQSLALGSFILFRLENAQRIYFFHSPSGQKDEKKNIQWHFSNSSAKLNHANWSQREQWQLLIPMLPVYPFQFLMRSTSRSPKKSVANHDPTLGINIKNHDQLLYFFGIYPIIPRQIWKQHLIQTGPNHPSSPRISTHPAARSEKSVHFLAPKSRSSSNFRTEHWKMLIGNSGNSSNLCPMRFHSSLMF